jgi:iron(III) transport system substrate-binding protein
MRLMKNRARMLAAALALAAIVLTGLALSACGGDSGSASGAGAERKFLVIYSTHGKENVEPVLERFKKAHPEITVEWRPFSTIDLFNALRAEKSDPQCDVWWGGPSGTFIRGEREGLLQPYRPAWADAVPAESHSPAGLWHGNYLMPECIMHNANVLTPEQAPQEWDDLLKPEWKGKIVLRDPAKSGTMRAIFGAMIWRFHQKTESPEQGYDWLRQLHANVAAYAPDPRAMYQALNSEETPVTVWNIVDAHVQSQQGYNFKAIIPASGVPVLIEGIGLVKDCPNPNNGKLFIDWVAQVDEAVYQAHEFHRIPARTDIPAEKLPDWMTQKKIVAMEIDQEIYMPLEEKWMDYFRENIQSK